MSGKSEFYRRRNVTQDNQSLITARARYNPFGQRTGLLRRVLSVAGEKPVIGPTVKVLRSTVPMPIDSSPLVIYQEAMRRATSEIDPSNRTLELTTLLDTILYLTDMHTWEPERLAMAEGLLKGLFDRHGDVSKSTWAMRRSAVGPFVLSNLVHAVLAKDKPLPTASEVADWFSHSENTHLKRRHYAGDLGYILAAAFGPAAAEYILLRLQPATTAVVENPGMTTALIAGGAAGLGAGVAAGLAIDALPGKDLSKAAKTIIPIATAILGMLTGSFATEHWVIPGIEQTIEVTHIPLNEHGWTIPLIAVAGGFIFGAPRLRKHKKAHAAIHTQLETHQDWKSTMMIMVNALDYQRKVNQHMAAQAPSPVVRDRINRALYTRHPALAGIIENYNPRDPAQVEILERVAGTTLKDLAEQVMIAEMIAWEKGYADITTGGKPNRTVKDLVPHVCDYFAAFCPKMLNLATETTAMVKQLLDSKDSIAALSVISPSLASIMIAQGQTGDMGANDDTLHFGWAGMNTGTRGVFPRLVSAVFNKTITVPDSKRAQLTNRLQELGRLYKEAIPIGGLDRIYQMPVHETLGVLYSYAYIRAQGHTLSDSSDPDSHGIYGSKGMMSDIGKAVLGSYEKNPLIAYIFMADLAFAIEHIDTFLANLAPRGERKTIKNALVSLQRDLATEILRKVFPRDKETSVKFFTDDKYAYEAYLALTMLTETCGNDVIQPIVEKQAAVLSPIFGLADSCMIASDPVISVERNAPSVAKFSGIVGDTPNLYSTQLIDFIHNGLRHTTGVHMRLVEFLQRGMLPLLVRQYFDRLRPGGRGEAFNQAQLENTLAFAGYALETVHKDDFPALADELILILESVNRTAVASVAPMGTIASIPPDIQTQANGAYRRTQALLQVAARIVSSRRHDLQKKTSGKTQEQMINSLIEEISKKMGETIRVKIAVK